MKSHLTQRFSGHVKMAAGPPLLARPYVKLLFIRL